MMAQDPDPFRDDPGLCWEYRRPYADPELMTSQIVPRIQDPRRTQDPEGIAGFKELFFLLTLSMFSNFYCVSIKKKSIIKFHL